MDGPLIPADALHSAIRRNFQSVPTPGHAGLLSVLHVSYTHKHTQALMLSMSFTLCKRDLCLNESDGFNRDSFYFGVCVFASCCRCTFQVRLIAEYEGYSMNERSVYPIYPFNLDICSDFILYVYQ